MIAWMFAASYLGSVGLMPLLVIEDGMLKLWLVQADGSAWVVDLTVKS